MILHVMNRVLSQHTPQANALLAPIGGVIARSRSRYISMAQTEFISPALEQKCHEAVNQLIARHHWALLPREELVRRTIEQV